MKTLTQPQISKSGSPSSDSWLQASVQDFFLSINWDDQPQGSDLPPPANYEVLSLSTSVSRFFAAFNWDGSATIAAPVPTKQLPVKESKGFTLDEFSNLF